MAPPEGVQTLIQTINVPEFSPNKETWFVWKEKLEIHFCEINCTEENQKKAILLKSVGTEPYNLLHSLCSPASPVSKTFKDLCIILETHYTPPTIIYRERKAFYNAVKSSEETVSQWFARVKKLALNCKFGDNLDAFIVDKFVISLPDKIFEKMCEENENLTSSAVLKKAMIWEIKFSNKEHQSSSVNFIKKKKNYDNSKRRNDKNPQKGDAKGKNPCKHCGWKNHDSASCKFKDSVCHSCSKRGHLANICRSRKDKNGVNLVQNVANENNDSFDFSIYSIVGDSNEALYTLRIEINGKQLDVVCDTGAPCTFIPFSLYKRLNIGKLDRCLKPYCDYNGKRISMIGEFSANVKYGNVMKMVKVCVTDTENPPLLGRSFLRAFKFELVQVNSIGKDEKFSVTIDQIKSEFSEVFQDGLGTYNGDTISLPMVNGAKPVFCKPRPLPLAWKDKIETQLRELIKNGVLEPIDNSDWGTPIVPVLKPNGDLRICADYKITINKYLENFKYPLPRIDEIFASLEGGEFFTKLDMASAYNQLVLDDSSQHLCALSTHIGTLKMKRMPFGIKTAAAIFQKTMEALLRGIPGVVVYQDDITVTGKDFSDHMKNLRAVLNKLKSAGLKLNPQKCAFFQQRISYLGFSIDKFGLSKNDERFSNILKAPVPSNVSELRAFVGMANHYSKFIENFAQKLTPLYALLRKDTEFNWSGDCQKAYELIKAEVTSDAVLVHFNPTLPIILTTDASNTAVAGVLSHRFPDGLIKPVAFVSRALSKSESNYSTLEKESLAIIFCVTKLRQYLIGNHFTLQTDHKPLVSIFGEHKSLPIMAAARMQRWAFILSGFDYTIEYVKGTENSADNLSRMPQNCVMDTVENTYVNFIESDNNLKINFKDIARETKRDPILSKLSEAISSGKMLDYDQPDFMPFKNKINELTVEHDCILWGYRVVIPLKFRQQILNELHSSHLGIVKTKALARSYVWWPKLDNDIENLIQNCEPCRELQASPEKAKLIPWKPSDSVWSRIHVDFAGPVRNFYLFVVVDSFSKWVEVFKTKTITSAFTISKLRDLFSHYGLVDVLVSDNGTQFTSDEFKKFLYLNGVKHILTAPGNPSTNGQAENFVKTLKKSLMACFNSSGDSDFDIILSRFLCDYRNTKHCTTGESPAKLFIGRSLKTRFSSLKPPLVKEIILSSQEKLIKNFKGKREISFKKNDNIYVRDFTKPNKPSWQKAKVKEQLGPRSYTCILLHNNREIKRHTDQIQGATFYSDLAENQANINENENVVSDVEPLPSTSNAEVGNSETVTQRNLRPRAGGKSVKLKDLKIVLPRLTDLANFNQKK